MKKIIIILSIVLLGCTNQNKYVEPETEVECSLPDSTDHSDDGHDDSDFMDEIMWIILTSSD